MDFPAIETSGFPGNRTDAYRAGMTASAMNYLPFIRHIICVAVRQEKKNATTLRKALTLNRFRGARKFSLEPSSPDVRIAQSTESTMR
jgi:hypothetical protein